MAVGPRAATTRGKWIMLQFSADFRWMRERTDSPWYPSVRLFRQGERNAWPPVIAVVAEELARQGAGPSGANLTLGARDGRLR